MKLDLYDINWHDLFVPAHPIETILRGSLMYLSLFLLMRFVLKRESGSIGTADLLMVVVIADAAQNAMAGDYKSITDGVILVVTIMFWNYAIDWLSYHSPTMRRVLQPKPLLLVKDGRLYKQNMRKELITKEELIAELRENGVEDLSEVKEARIEEDGHVSVIK
ncbi:MAG TPA: YetF domain-containing protein, partial [Pyrinomonadaceae bacterium]